MTNPLIQRINQRLTELGISAQAASIKATGSRDVIRAILSGATKSPRLETLEKIALALETTPEWLMGKTENASSVSVAHVKLPDRTEMPANVPVMGTGPGPLDDGAFVMEGGIVDFVRRPPALAGTRDVYTLYVEGTSMEPRYLAGDLIFVHPHRPARIGDSVIVQYSPDEDGPVCASIGHFKGRDSKTVKLGKLNPPTIAEIPRQQVISIHKVLDMNELFGI